jgi:hypothetical protein
MTDWLSGVSRRTEGWRRTDTMGIGLLTLVYITIQIHAIAAEGFRAQDYFTHKTWVNQAFSEGLKFLVTYGENRSNPPLFHFLGSLIQRADPVDYMRGLAYFNLLCSLLALGAAFHLIQIFIADQYLRIASFASFALLPSFVIQSTAIAADSLATALFLLYVCCVTRLSDADWGAKFWQAAGWASVLLLFGVVTKFTFLSQVLGAAILIGVAAVRKRLTARRAALAFLIVVVPAFLVGRWQVGLYQSQTKYNNGIVPGRGLAGAFAATLNPRSVFLPRSGDAELLSAPQYLTRENGEVMLFRPNGHSYPGLLHFGAFTDLLNAYQYDPFHDYFGLRSPFAQMAMSLAVKSGLWLTLLAISGIVWLGACSLRSLLPRWPLDLKLLTVVVSALGWYLNIAVFLPFVGSPYSGGYWHPRLVTPAIIIFLILGFCLLQRLVGWWAAAPKVFLGLVLFQCGVHATFLWPSERDVSDYIEADKDLDRSRPAFQVNYLTGQGQEGTKVEPFFWVGDALGIVVRRYDPRIPVQGYMLSMKLSAGLADPDPTRRVAIRLPDGSRQEVEFQGSRTIEVPVSLPQGRSLIALEVLEPRQQKVIVPGDGRTHMVNVSGLRWRFLSPFKGGAPDPHLSVVNSQGAVGTPGEFYYPIKDFLEIVVQNPNVHFPLARYELRFEAVPGDGAGEPAVLAVSPPGTEFSVPKAIDVKVPISLSPGSNRFIVQYTGGNGMVKQPSIRNVELVLVDGYEGQSFEPIKDAGPFSAQTTLTLVNPQGEDRGSDGVPWYWVGSPAEIRIEKRSQPTVTDGYRLQFRLDAGLGDPDPRRTVRFEFPGGEGVNLNFVGTRVVDMPIRLQMGRQTFRVVPVTPAKNKAPVPNDPRTLILRLSGVRLVEPAPNR